MKTRVLIFLLIICSNIATGANIIPIALKEATIQDMISILYGIIAATAVVMIIFHGLKWITADDEEDRKQARKGVINVLIGLVFILLAAALVDMAYTEPSY